MTQIWRGKKIGRGEGKEKEKERKRMGGWGGGGGGGGGGGERIRVSNQSCIDSRQRSNPLNHLTSNSEAFFQESL